VVDNADSGFSVVSGGWYTYTSAQQYASNYRMTTTSSGAESARVRWSGTSLPAGRYRVEVWYVDGWNRTQRAPYVIKDGTVELETIRINQVSGGGQWVELGTYTFIHPAPAVELHNGQSKVLSSESYLTADAVRFTAVP